MATIPEEYADFDFGFSAVDDEEYKAKTTEVEKKIEQVQAKSENLENLEKKIDEAIKEISYKKEYLEEKYKEDRKDERTRIQASQQSELIEQRKDKKGAQQFESAGNDTMGSGFNMEAFEPK